MQLTAHAYVAQGSAETIEDVLALLRQDGIKTEGNPDVYVRAYSAFLMDDARELRERANLRAIGDGGRTFVIAAPSIPADAQNALLKTFEEPPAGARFFIIVPAPETLLPTLRSRVQILDLNIGHTVSDLIDVSEFLEAAVQKRLNMLKPLLDKDDDDRRDLAGAVAFLGALERELGEKSRENIKGLKAVYQARKYITDRGAIVKSLLEQVALLV